MQLYKFHNPEVKNDCGGRAVGFHVNVKKVRSANGAERFYESVVECIPAAKSPTGRRQWRTVSRDRVMVELVHSMRSLSQRQRRLEELCADDESHLSRRGRPPTHEDAALLAYLGCTRRGNRIIESRAMPLAERARRRYALLSAEWRAVLTEEDMLQLEREVVGARKQANRLGQLWDDARFRDGWLRKLLPPTAFP